MPEFNLASELEIERLGRVIAAAEPWSSEYEKDEDTHNAIIKAESKLETALRAYLRTLSEERIDRIINWYQYMTIRGADKPAYEVDVTINDDAMEGEISILMNMVYDPMLEAVAVGAMAGEAIYEIPLGMTSTTDTVQDAARKHVATLVTQINEGTRGKIRSSIKTSISLGEDQKTASARLNKVIKDPKRAQTIARTEAVNSYSLGLETFGIESGATSKTWQSVPGACAICSPLDGQTEPIGEDFPSIGRPGPSAHPNCRCGKRLNYENHA